MDGSGLLLMYTCVIDQLPKRTMLKFEWHQSIEVYNLLCVKVCVTKGNRVRGGNIQGAVPNISRCE